MAITPKNRKTRTGRRSPLASIALITIGLLATGGAYALFTSSATADTTSAQTELTTEGSKLFAANCATCHGMNLQGTSAGPSLIGVGAASVDFQVSTGRMPLAASGPQAEEKPAQFTDAQIKALYTFVASKAPGPGIPDESLLKGDGDTAAGAELFRINCAMCHNVAGAGGALTEGKFAPSLSGVSAKHIIEAMETGPQNMPVFNDNNISPTDKANIVTYLKYLDNNPSPGGFDLGNLGPVSEGLFLWIFGLGTIVGVTVWLTARAN
jgi:ubiquinol-cytochrome c reductase cytochrome c subunit